MENYLSIKGHFLLRGKGEGKYGNRVMMIGVLEDTNIILQNKDDLNHGEIWVMQFIVVEKRRFKVPERTYGMRADQFLCTSIHPDELEEIKESPLAGTVKCVACGATKEIGPKEIEAGEQPMCDICFMPMIAEKAGTGEPND